MASRLPSIVLALVLTACTSREPTPDAPAVAGPGPDRTAIAWRCSDVDLVFFPGEGGRAKLRVNEELRDVTLRPTKTGMEWADDQVSFWSYGGEAKVTLPDTARICFFDPGQTDLEEARLRGVTFRGVGSGSVLEITADKATLSGPSALSMPAGAPATDPATGVMTWSATDGTHALTVTATPGVCTDPSNGRTSPWTVAATVDGAPWQGCGDKLD